MAIDEEAGEELRKLAKSRHFLETFNKSLKKFDRTCGHYDYVLDTDGSGHYVDKIGGASACFFHTRDPLNHVRVLVAKDHTTVPRMEFEALIEGVKEICFHDYFYTGARVLWISDCKSLVDSVNGPGGRGANTDLWVWFEYFEKDLIVDALHIPRKHDIPTHKDVDLHASTLREMLKHYINTLNE